MLVNDGFGVFCFFVYRIPLVLELWGLGTARLDLHVSHFVLFEH